MALSDIEPSLLDILQNYDVQGRDAYRDIIAQTLIMAGEKGIDVRGLVEAAVKIASDDQSGGTGSGPGFPAGVRGWKGETGPDKDLVKILIGKIIWGRDAVGVWRPEIRSLRTMEIVISSGIYTPLGDAELGAAYEELSAQLRTQYR